jgi:hypothetical protein
MRKNGEIYERIEWGMKITEFGIGIVKPKWLK